MSEKMSGPIKADYGVLLLALVITVGAFTGWFLGRATFAELMAITAGPWAFYFGRVNGRANGGKRP